MKKIFHCLILLTFSSVCRSQDYTFNGSMTREKLELYLSRAITMQGLTDEISCYFPPCTSSSQTLYNPVANATSIKMLSDINARFIGRACGLWGLEWSILLGYFSNVQRTVNNINSEYSSKQLVKPIIQAGIFEIVSESVNGIEMSNEVAKVYNEQIRNFRFDEMKYDDFPSNANYLTARNADLTEIVPDISKKETQMWFYFLATNYIDKGIEAIHFGAIDAMNKNDPENEYYGDLLAKIRNYAKLKNRGIVLCDAHTDGLYYNNTNNLLFDFHSYPLRIKEDIYNHFGGNTGGNATLDYNYCNAIYGRSKGGKTFFGWECASLPYLVEIDNDGITENPNMFGSVCYPWGYDEFTWYALQNESYRNDWLRYAQYKVKCLDENGFLQVPGMRGLDILPWPNIYRAATGYYNQQKTIKDLWNGVYMSPFNLIHHNFTNEFVANQPNIPNVNASLFYKGNNKLFYIGTDGYIHGYINENGSSELWRTVSPSYSAQFNHNQNVANQVKAKSDLCLSPDGSLLIYIGIDGLIHGYKVHDNWDYSYFDLGVNQMISQNLRAKSNLLFASDSKIFYVANENNGIGNSRVHGFVKYNGQWITVSPTYSSQVSSNSMQEVGGALTYNSNSNRLYFVGKDGFLYYYLVNNNWSYTYVTVSKTSLQSQNLKIVPSKLCTYQNRVYFIGSELLSGNIGRIHCLEDNNNNWISISPSWSAHLYNNQNINNQVISNFQDITLSPDGKEIAYIGIDQKVYFYKDVGNGFHYTYNSTYGSNGISATNSLEFIDNSYLCYISNSDKKVHYIKSQEAYCLNNELFIIEPKFVYFKKDENEYIKYNGDTPNVIISNNLLIDEYQIYPIPSSSQLNIEFSSSPDNPIEYEVIDVNSKILCSGYFYSKLSNLNTDLLVNGIYLLKLKKENYEYISKFVILK